ncbi:MAG: hypothetical protein SWJ54_17435 [Cyanobacteriota bacterium]|nr:hypothetical protein [Cyanobacteriota bacterium]
MIKFKTVLGLTLSIAISFQNTASAQAIANPQDRSSERALKEIQAEIYPSVRRLSPMLNTWLVVAVLVSTTAATTAIFLLVLSAQKIQQSQQNIKATKQNIVSDLSKSLSEAQATVNELQYSIQVSQNNLQKRLPQVSPSSQIEDDSSSESIDA